MAKSTWSAKGVAVLASAALAWAVLPGPAVAGGGGGPGGRAAAAPAVPTLAAPPAVPTQADPGDLAPELSQVPLTVDPVLTDRVEDGVAGAGEPFAAPAPSAADADVLSATGATGGVTVVGVTWPRGSASADPDIEIRTRSGSVWGPWLPLHADQQAAGDGGRDGTEPFIAGVVDVVQVAFRDGSGRPRDVRLVVAGADSAPAGAAASTAAPDAAATLAAPDAAATLAASAPGTVALRASVARPQIYTRAQWGADESKMTWAPQTGWVHASDVHHTAGVNDYTSAQVPSILRGIYAYHAEGRDWGDIGYNFLVDRFGRIWEGRAGGMDRAVIGAHAKGVNDETVGVSFMGNYDVVPVPTTMVDAAARVIAWKFGLHGVRAGTNVTIDGVVRSTIFGHRDVAQTTCPGRYLYAKLPELRSKVAARMAGAVARQYTRDLSGDGYADLVLRDGGAASLATATNAGWRSPTSAGSGFTARTYSAGDWNRDGRPDLLWVDSTGALWLSLGSAAGWQQRVALGSSGWNAMGLFTSGQDWDGDGRVDIIARRNSDGTLFLYPGTASGLGPRRSIGAGWNSMTAATLLGDLSDGRPGLLGRAQDGTLYAYRGNGTGGFAGSRTKVGSGWQTMTSILAAGDLNGDGRADVVARDGGGGLYFYAGTGSGALWGSTRIGTGWGQFAAVAPAGLAGPGQDFFAVSTAAKALRYRFDGFASFDRVAGTGIAVDAGTVELIAAGDWDRDGVGDVLQRRSDGVLRLHRGRGDGTFAAAGTQIGTGWQVMRHVIGAGNWLGNGLPSLLALRTSGQIWLYRGDGRGGFGTPLLIASGATNVDRLVNASTWTGRLVPDLLTRTKSGELQLRRGGGAALLGAPVVIGTGWGTYVDVVGGGDADGDARPDLLGTRPDGTLMLRQGNGSGGFGPVRSVGSLPAGATIS